MISSRRVSCLPLIKEATVLEAVTVLIGTEGALLSVGGHTSSGEWDGVRFQYPVSVVISNVLDEELFTFGRNPAAGERGKSVIMENGEFLKPASRKRYYS